MADYTKLVQFIKKWEGGFGNHPKDKGGATNKGVTLATYRMVYGKNKTVDVTIPAGIKDQQILNVSGRGNSGTNGGPAGDLHVYVNVRPHPVFERRGDDVWCEVPITFTQAALGADVVVPTLDGKVSYTVREGTQPGDVFRLKGKGIQRLGGRGRGDQYVRVTVEVPKNLNGKQKELIKQLDGATGDKNYAKRRNFFDKIKKMFNE